MSHHVPAKLERWPLLGLLALVLFAIGAVMVGSSTGTGLQKRDVPRLAQSRTVHFADGASGEVQAIDAESGAIFATFGAGEGGFARTALRALAYSRKIHGVGPQAPFVLARAEDGQIILHDPATGKTVGISAFGDTHEEQFAALLDAGRSVQ